MKLRAAFKLDLASIGGLVTSAMLALPILPASRCMAKDAALADKARNFEEVIRERHVWKGFIRELTLNILGDPAGGGVLHHNDNDGLWTGLYAAAMSFNYAVTRDEQARQWAKESFHALERLEAVTGIPGFPARSIVKAGDPKNFKYDGEWHPDSTGEWEWKGDTSSDEIAGHFFAYSVYYDLAADEEEKKRIRRLVGRVMDHIIGHQGYLADTDGKPTRWGVWNPAQLNENKPVHGLPDEDWSEERGLNSLEILSHLKAAYHITGSGKYQMKYLELIDRHGYAQNTLKALDPRDINHSDVELAFLAYYPLLKYENDPAPAAVYKESLRRTWSIVRPEKNPWWDFTVCAFIPEDCDASGSIRALSDIPAEQVNRKGTGLQRWNGDPYRPAEGNGEIEGDGVVFLLPYWMGRYHGFIH